MKKKVLMVSLFAFVCLVVLSLTNTVSAAENVDDTKYASVQDNTQNDTLAGEGSLEPDIAVVDKVKKLLLHMMRQN